MFLKFGDKIREANQTLLAQQYIDLCLASMFRKKQIIKKITVLVATYALSPMLYAKIVKGNRLPATNRSAIFRSTHASSLKQWWSGAPSRFYFHLTG